jgi:hypothetical protein
MSDNIKILVCAHKECEFPKDDIYLPIQVGKAISDTDLGIQGDDTGDNISKKNKIYCEMSAVYWAWKNVRTIYPDIEYIGLCHYRRYFTFNNYFIRNSIRKLLKYFKDIMIVLFRIKSSYYLFDTQIVRSFNRSHSILKYFSNNIYTYLENNKIDILATRQIRFNRINVENFFSVIGRHHIELLKEIVNDNYPEYFPVLINILNGYYLSAANMFIMKISIFDNYCSFVFSVLEKHISLCKCRNIHIDPENEKSYERISGYLSELLTFCFISKNQKCNIVKYCNKLFISE